MFKKMEKRDFFLYKKELCEFSLKVKELADEWQLKINREFPRLAIESAGIIYEAMRFQVDCEIGKYTDHEVESKKKHGMARMKQCLGISAEEKIPYKILYELTEEKGSMLLVSLDEFKKDIYRLYQQCIPYLLHISSVPGLSFISPSLHRENMYYNEICDAVFATSKYEEVLLYMGRVYGGEMTVLNDLCIYRRKPYHSWDDKEICLKQKAVLYYLRAEEFEPVIDFVISDTGKSRLLFGHEWLRRGEASVCKAQEIAAIPTREMREYRLFYGLKDISLASYIDNFKQVYKSEEGEGYLQKLVNEKIVAHVDLGQEERGC